MSSSEMPDCYDGPSKMTMRMLKWWAEDKGVKVDNSLERCLRLAYIDGKLKAFQEAEGFMDAARTAPEDQR